MGLTDLIQTMIDENKQTQEATTQVQNDFKALKEIVDKQTSDAHIIDLMQNEFYKSDYFVSEEFFNQVGESLIATYGLGKLVTLDSAATHQAIKEYLSSTLNHEEIVNHLMKFHKDEIRQAMIRRIRIESKSILDNYDFSNQVLPRLEVMFKEFLAQDELISYVINGTARLFVAQETNLNFMLEYLLNKEIST